MDDRCLLQAARYIEPNPVRAKLVKSPEEYPWSSAAAHLSGADDVLVRVAPLLSRTDSWQASLREKIDEHAIPMLQKHERTGRPLGGESFIRTLEKETGRTFSPKKPGPKGKKQVQ